MAKIKERQEELDLWRLEHPSLFENLVNFCKKRLKHKNIEQVTNEIKARRSGYDSLLPKDVSYLIREYVHPSLFVKNRINIELPISIRQMIGELGVDPSEFTTNLLWWYYHEVYVKNSNREIEKEKLDNEIKRFEP